MINYCCWIELISEFLLRDWRVLWCPVEILKESFSFASIISATSGDRGPWGEWTQCSKSCGHGSRLRTRGCKNSACGGSENCFDDFAEAEVCFVEDCKGMYICVQICAYIRSIYNSNWKYWIIQGLSKDWTVNFRRHHQYRKRLLISGFLWRHLHLFQKHDRGHLLHTRQHP